ncbi:hypothetical protein, partial [Paraburkholderia sp. SIMBA_027]|uniref:hypothetical protein n=1 Tax=Paraburkholderia sp. SIMBA_027 TaxID=3085770 RepID=UPI0039793B19
GRLAIFLVPLRARRLGLRAGRRCFGAALFGLNAISFQRIAVRYFVRRRDVRRRVALQFVRLRVRFVDRRFAGFLRRFHRRHV